MDRVVPEGVVDAEGAKVCIPELDLELLMLPLEILKDRGPFSLADEVKPVFAVLVSDDRPVGVVVCGSQR